MDRTSLKRIVNTIIACLLATSSFSFLGCGLAARHHNVLGREAFESGQVSKAINEFQLALSKDRNNSDAYYNLGATYYTLAKQSRNNQWMDQSEQLLRQSIALNPTNVDAHRTLAGLLVESGRSQFALDLLNAWQQRNPFSADPLVELARLYQEFGDTPRATNYLADAMRIDSNNPRVLSAMGHVRERQGQLAQALENYIRSYQIDQRQTDVAAKITDLQTRIAGLPYPYNGGTPPQTLQYQR